jgi:hypothetical protein
MDLTNFVHQKFPNIGGGTPGNFFNKPTLWGSSLTWI